MVTALHPTVFHCYRCGTAHRAYLKVPVICCGQIYRYRDLYPARPETEETHGHLPHPSAQEPPERLSLADDVVDLDAASDDAAEHPEPVPEGHDPGDADPTP